MKKIKASISGLYCVFIRAIESYVNMSWKLINPDEFELWHDRFSHLGATIMRRIILNSRGHPLKNTKILLSKDYFYETCSQGKLITRPSMTKVDPESLSFLQRIQGDIYGPIHPASGLFRYFMVSVDASCRWSHVLPVIHVQRRFCTFI